jgi:ketosteroid isomerase-like protein
MSQENVERLRASLEAFVSNDVAGVLRHADPEVHFEPRLAVLQGVYAGHDGVRAFLADAWENLTVVGIDYRDVRDLGDRVLALGSFRIGGVGSGVETETPFAIVASFRDDRIVHLKDYGDKDEALEAVGSSRT